MKRKTIPRGKADQSSFRKYIYKKKQSCVVIEKMKTGIKLGKYSIKTY